MKIISIYHPEAIQIAENILSNDGIIAFPTDTVYGLASLAASSKGIDRLYKVKGRDLGKAIPCLIGSISQLTCLTDEVPPIAKILIEKFWPGALTIVFKKTASLPENISQTDTIGIRMPNHRFALSLLQAVGPLAVTSANLSGKENPQSGLDVLNQLGDWVDLLLDGGRTSGNIPSSVVDCSEKQIRFLRQGVIPFDVIQSILILKDFLDS